MPDRNTHIKKGQLGDQSVEPIDLDLTGEANTGQVPSLGGDGKFLWITPSDLTKEGFNEGLLSDPTIEDVSGLAISVSSVDVLIRSDINFPDYLYKFTVEADDDLEVEDNILNYVYVDYNEGSPIYKVSTSRDTINNSNHIPVARIFIIDGNIEYQMKYGYVARSNAIRNFDRIMRCRGNAGEEKEDGLVLTETATRVVNITSGHVWFGNNRITLDEIVMAETGVVSQLWSHGIGGIWEHNDITQYDNTYYDNGTGLVELTANRYCVNWIFRNLTTNEMDIVLGRGDYTLAQATGSSIPALPQQITNFYILCGRIIIQKGASIAYSIQTVTDVSFRTSSVTIHNDLGGLNNGDYVHLTSSEKTNVDDAITKRHTQNTDIGTNQNDFAIGDGADSDKDITAHNGDGSEPKLRYDAGTNKWQYSNNGVDFVDIGSGAGASALADLTDVDFDTGTPIDGQVLTYDEVSEKWKAEESVAGLFAIDINGDLMPITEVQSDNNFDLDGNDDIQPKV